MDPGETGQVEALRVCWSLGLCVSLCVALMCVCLCVFECVCLCLCVFLFVRSAKLKKII